MVRIHRILAAACLLLAACDDPTRPRSAPTLRSLSLFMVLDPDAATQPLLIKPPQAADSIGTLSGELFLGQQRVAAITRDYTGDEFHPCAIRYGPLTGTGAPARCLDFALDVRHGATYRVEARAEGRPVATASVTVPGAFRIVSHSVRGAPPGTEGLEATWTRSEGAYRYAVSIRSDALIECFWTHCQEGLWEQEPWFAVTADTSISVTVPAERIRAGKGGWHLEIYAMDRVLFEHLTTGTVAEPFPVPPTQNVRGGYGAVGAWVRRSVPLGS